MNLVNHERQHSGLFPILAIFAVALMVSACSTTGGIVPAATTKSGFDGAVFKGETIVTNEKSLTGTEYRVFNHGATSFTSNAANRENAEQRATSYCKSNNGEYRLLRETTSVPPHILGNFPRVGAKVETGV